MRRPDFAPEQLHAGPCTGSLLLVSRPTWRQLNGMRPDLGDGAGYDLVLRLLDARLPMRHVPTLVVRMLLRGMTADDAVRNQAPYALRAHAARLGARLRPGTIPGCVRFQPAVGPPTPVSIVITASSEYHRGPGGGGKAAPR